MFKKLISKYHKFLKLRSLSNIKNWELTKERGWSIEIDYTSKPRKFYKHKKYSYFITMAFINNPVELIILIDRFIVDYKNNDLLMNETFYFICD